MSAQQRTIAKDIKLSGHGVHSGEAATVTLKPAAAGSGISFRRIDLDGSPEVRATLDNVSDTRLGTTVGDGDTKVLTVEHLLASLVACQIDNVMIDVDGPEIPIRDGSFHDYFSAVRDAGVQELDAPAKVIRLKGPVADSKNGGQSYVAAPASGLTVSATIDFEHTAIGRQFGSFVVEANSFESQIARARTFGFKSDAEALRAEGLAKGASLENTVVLDEAGVMNDGLRFDDEFLRHKVGDIVGDLGLLGARLEAHVVAERPSHAGNVALARAIAAHARHGSREALMDVTKIMEYLPHRYPMLLVDRITDYDPGKRVVGIKNVTINEPFFQGHFPGHPVMPGVLIVEAMAQVGGLLLMDQVENPEGKVVYFMSVDRVKWRRPVTPGDTLVFELEMLQFRRGVCKVQGKAFVEGVLVSEAELMATIVDK